MKSWLDDRDRLLAGDEVLFALFSAVVLYLSKMSVLNVPYFWDELIVYVNPIRLVYEQGLGRMIWDGSLFNPSNFFFHPFGLPLLFLPLLNLFGHSVWLLRFCALFCVWGSLFFTYKIGKIIHGKILGFCGAVSLFSIPLVFAQSTMILGDIFFMLFSSIFFFLLIQGRKFWQLLVVGLLMGFIRETALAFVPVAGVYFCYRKDFSLRSWAIILSPAIGIIFFFLFAGFGHQAFTEGHISFQNLKEGCITSFRLAFFDDYKDILLYPALFFAFILLLFPKFKEKHGVNNENLVLLVLLILLFAAFFSFDKGVLSRYFNPILPFFTLLCFYPLVRFSRLMAILFLFIVAIRIPEYAFTTNNFQLGSGHETRMEFQEVLKVQKEAARYLELEHPLKRIWTSWPIDVMLSDSFFGYVTHSLKVVNQKEAERGDFDLYVWASNMKVEFASLDERDLWIKNQKLKLIKNFTYKNKWVEIYSR